MSKVKWFLGEFFVVVAGVLVAFVLNGWWMAVKERNLEREYLKYIHSDLESTIQIVEVAEKQQRATLYASSRLLSISFSIQIPSDSIIAIDILKSMTFAPAAQVSATLSSLVSTGNLQLISDDSLRIALNTMLSSLEAYERNNEQMAFQWLIPAYERFADAANLSELRFQAFDDATLERIAQDSLSGFASPSDLLRPKPQVLPELIRDKAFIQNLTKLHIAQKNLYNLHSDFLSELTGARDLLEAKMKVKQVSFQ